MTTGATQLSAADFPGYAEAVARENLIRAASCIGINETVCGIEVRPLTARHVRFLAMVNSPFLMREITGARLVEKPGIVNDCMAFLWIVSPRFKPANRRAQAKFFKHLGQSGLMKAKVDALCQAILDFVDESYLDAPAADNNPKSYFAFELSIVNSLHRSWGLPVDFWNHHPLRNWFRRITGQVCPLDVPLKIVWQNMKEQLQFANPEMTLTNGSDRKLADGLTIINQRNREAAEQAQRN